MQIDFNPQLLKSSERFLNQLEKECKKLNSKGKDSLQDIRLLQNEIDELMSSWEV